ncbi:hypothetical protein Aeqsu_2560 [Aequorivita sublithincola DSM 14238]|uniref:Uncharacterized protein n=1 Tax=Aequorivita sublithincola (strain DSM 14238 / LMG 21431 / ACAM 643 / 9-3) TaxID=746697 RepID=I3YYE7_AEQSU|nr:hypothetical protein [Aequorivita sublithincola]AFL82015.1 hypothetical protein Aeqsu_2560 [Aequorivita sublithincola DSM 14238]
MNSTRTLKSIIVALLLTLGYSLYYINGLEIGEEEGLCLDYSNQPMSELAVALVHKMSNNYKSNQLSVINNDTSNRFTTTAGKGDTRAIWFDLETLKAFLYHLEIETKKKDASISGTDLGVRIYYASYPDTTSWGLFPDLVGLSGSDYEDHHTLVMIPTIRNKNNVDVDFNPLEQRTFSDGLGVILDYENSEASNPQKTFALAGIKKSSSSNQNTSQRTGAQNHGNLYPPLGEIGLGF